MCLESEPGYGSKRILEKLGQPGQPHSATYLHQHHSGVLRLSRVAQVAVQPGSTGGRQQHLDSPHEWLPLHLSESAPRGWPRLLLRPGSTGDAFANPTYFPEGSGHIGPAERPVLFSFMSCKERGLCHNLADVERGSCGATWVTPRSDQKGQDRGLRLRCVPR